MIKQNNASVKIIAEIAQGFEGSPLQSALLIKAAATAGADAVKFQLVFADELATVDYEHYQLFKSLEMSDNDWSNLYELANQLEVDLQFDVFGLQSLALAEKIGIQTVKLHGTDIANIGFLESVSDSKIDSVILGAGGATKTEIERALGVLRNKTVILLFGFQAYPTPIGDNQISRVRFAKTHFENKQRKLLVGFADHAEPDANTSFALAATAVGAGANVIEKHLTLGKVMRLEDHESALNPDEFLIFCETIRACARAYGEIADIDNIDDFAMSEAEKGYRKMIRRHVILARDMEAGEELTPLDVVLRRSSVSSPITDLNLVYGKRLVHSAKRLKPLLIDDLKE